VSDFRDRLGAQLAASAASLLAASETDFRARFGAQLAVAAAELAGARQTVPAPAPSARRWLPRLRPRQLAPGLVLADFRARFGLQLANAATELTGARRPLTRARRRWRAPWLTRPVAIGLALTAFAGSAFAAVAVWTPLLGNQQYGYNPGAATSAPPATQLADLAVLRRPQTAADRGALSAAALTYINDYTEGVRTAYVRLLATVGSEAFVLVPVEERTETPTSTPLADALCLYVSDSSVGLTHVACWGLADVLAGKAAATFDGRFFGLAPDGAVTATLSSVAGPQLSAPVASNLFVMTLPPSSAPPVAEPSVSFSHS
jgi:hypothetical protein